MPPRNHAAEETITLGPETRMKVDLKTLATVGGTLIAATIWAYNMWSDVQMTKADIKEIKEDYKSIHKEISAIRRIVDPVAVGPKKKEDEDK